MTEELGASQGDKVEDVLVMPDYLEDMVDPDDLDASWEILEPQKNESPKEYVLAVLSVLPDDAEAWTSIWDELNNNWTDEVHPHVIGDIETSYAQQITEVVEAMYPEKK